jgi:hypothetical protein
MSRPETLPRALALIVAILCGACDEPSAKSSVPEATATAAVTPQAAPEPPRAPDILVDAANVSIDRDRVAVGELGLADKVAVFVTGRPAIAGNTVSFVAMRNAKPSSVVAIVTALRKAKAAGAVVKSDARDGTTQKVPLSFTTSVADCATVAWITKDAAIEVWPAGGGTAKKVIKGLAGPDMTLGLEAMRKQWSSCAASELVVGADDAMTWGLVFDLATTGLQAPGTRTSTAVLVANPAPGRKLVLE